MEEFKRKEVTTDGRTVIYGQHANGLYFSEIRDAQTGLVDSAIIDTTMAAINRWWAEHNVDFLNN